MSLAEELQARGHDAKAVPGQKSQFDVVADGSLVFSKQVEGRYPDATELLPNL